MLSDIVENCAEALFRAKITMAVLDIIMESVPELTALDFSDNNLSALDSLIGLAIKVPHLRILHTGRNPVSFCIQSDHCYIMFQFVLNHCKAGFSSLLPTVSIE
jgi:hypothetical protein